MSESKAVSRRGQRSSGRVAVEGLEGRRMLAGVGKDTTFGNGGVVYSNFGSYYDEVAGIEATADNKVVAFGKGKSGFKVVRYNANGTPDSTFGASGVASVGTVEYGYGLAVQSDGKVLVAGEYTVPSPGGSFVGEGLVVARLNANGTLDTTFGTGGYFKYQALAYVRRGAITLQADGKILVSGFEDNFSGTSDDWLLMRLTTSGKLDTTFAGTGVVVRDFGQDDFLGQVAVQPDGKIVGVGYQSTQSLGPWTGLVARYNTDGSLDPTFGTGGVAALSQQMQSNGVALESSGRILAIGFEQMVGLTPGGQVDPAFGTGGVVNFGLPHPYGVSTARVVNDKITLGLTYVYPDYKQDLAIYRYNADGTADTTFNGTGSIKLDYGWDSERLDDLAIDPAGRILLGGYGNAATGDWLVARVTTGPVTPPPALGTLGGFTFDDVNANGLYDSNETKTANKTVFLDANNNGKLDGGEKSVVTGSGGTWNFVNLAAGVYHVRRVFPSGYVQSNAPIDVTLAPGQTVTGLSIGSKSGSVPPPATGSIGGFAFDDKNKNGLFDAGDNTAAGKTIWLDLDDDGVKDGNEPTVVTAGDGKFAFAKLAAGTYHVRRAFPAGYAESSPARYVTLTSSQAVTGVSIGSRAV